MQQTLTTGQPNNSSQDCTPAIGDLVFGWGISDDYNLDLVAVPGADEFLSRQDGSLRDFAALREAGSGNGIMVFHADYVGFGGQGESTIVSARISSSASVPRALGPYAKYQSSLGTPDMLVDPLHAFLQELGAVKDDLADEFVIARKKRFPSLTDESALGILGLERGIHRAPSRALAAYREDVRLARDHWAIVGTALGMLEALVRLGYSQCQVIETWRSDSSRWNEIEVSILEPSITDWDAHLTLETKKRIVNEVLRHTPSHLRLREIRCDTTTVIYRRLKWGEEINKKWKWTPRKWGQGVIL
jgi:hypothetical protein